MSVIKNLMLGRFFFWLIVTITILTFFHFFPAIDLWFSGLFFADGDWFWRAPLLLFVREFYSWGTFFIALGFIVMAVYTLFAKTIVDRRIYRFGAAFSLIGPGLIVNALFKSHWGRARPSKVEEFGGSLDFTPASIIPVDQCDTKCSFVSGEGSGAAVMMFTLLMLFGVSPKLRLLIIAISAPMGFLRIAFGRHFTSDVLLSFTMMWSLGYLLMWYFDLTPETMRSKLGDFGRDMRRLVVGWF